MTTPPIYTDQEILGLRAVYQRFCDGARGTAAALLHQGFPKDPKDLPRLSKEMYITEEGGGTGRTTLHILIYGIPRENIPIAMEEWAGSDLAQGILLWRINTGK